MDSKNKKKRLKFNNSYKSISTVVYHVIVLNLLLLASLLPVITFGAGLAASFRILKEIYSTEKNEAIVAPFFKHFKRLFFRATIVWIGIIISTSTLLLVLPLVGQLDFIMLTIVTVYTVLLILFSESYFKILGYSHIDDRFVNILQEAMIRGLVRFPFTLLSFFLFIFLIFIGFSTGFLLFLFLGAYVHISFFIFPPPQSWIYKDRKS